MPSDEAPPTRYRCSDLILALFCFNRQNWSISKDNFSDNDEGKGKNTHQREVQRRAQQRRLLETIELEVTPTIRYRLVLFEVCSLLHSYALAGRKCIPLIHEVDHVLQTHLDTLTWRQIGTVLWAYARLHHRPSFVPRLGAMYISMSKTKGTRRMNWFEHSLLCRSLWALAVLQVDKQL